MDRRSGAAPVGLRDLYAVRPDARPKAISDLLKACEAPLICRKNEAVRSAGKSRLLGRAVQLPEDLMSVLLVEPAKDRLYAAHLNARHVRKEPECAAKLGLREAQDSRRPILKGLNSGARIHMLEAGAKSGIERILISARVPTVSRTASTLRRVKGPGRSEAIRRLVEIGLKVRK